MRRISGRGWLTPGGVALAVAMAGQVSARAAEPAPVPARAGMVVTAQRLASQVGAQVLAHGGNAVDAAVAVGYALAVTYPAAGNLGGGGFMTVRMADGRAAFLDFREKAPLAATATMFLDAHGAPDRQKSWASWLAVGVPGTPAGLEAARRRFGTESRQALMAPAIALARDGFRLTPADLGLFALLRDRLAADPATARIFLPDGALPAPGAIFRQPDLAASLSRISAEGPARAFYDGPIGAAMVAASGRNGGILAKKDFTDYRVRWLAPVRCSYRGFAIMSAPPPSSGGVTLCEALTILAGYDLGAMGFHSAAEIHYLAEAMRRAFHDRNLRLGDPDFVHNPVAELTSPAYAAHLRAQIAPDKATPSSALGADPVSPAREQPQTTQYSIVDRYGNAVSVTYTLNGFFGIGRVSPGTGILMNNEMDDFAAKPGSANMFGLVQGDANAIAPGKTPLSSMTPTIMTRDGKLALVTGSPGGPRIITTVLQDIVNMVDFGMNVAEAIDAPRIHEQWLPDVIYTEPYAVSADTAAKLTEEGYRLVPGGLWSNAEAIAVGAPTLTPARPAAGIAPYLPGATLFGASDVRGAPGDAAPVN